MVSVKQSLGEAINRKGQRSGPSAISTGSVFALGLLLGACMPKGPSKAMDNKPVDAVSAEANRSASSEVPPGVGLRRQVLSADPSDFGLSEPAPVWGVVMDLGLGQGEAASIVAVMDGNASLYTTGSFGIIGGGGHANVRRAASRACKLAVEVLEQAQPVDDFDYPKGDDVRFFLLTETGRRAAMFSEEQVRAEDHAFFPLYAAMQEVLAALRQISEEGP